MEPVLLFQCILLLCLFFYSIKYFTRTKNHKRTLILPPSPPKLPLIGNLHQLGSLPHRTLFDLSNKYGSLMLLNIGRIPTVIVSSAEALREITKNHDTFFAGRPSMKAADVYFYGYKDVIFCPYGDYWRQMKKISVIEVLSQKRVGEFKHVRDDEVTKFLDQITLSSQQGRCPVNLTEMLTIFTSNVISRSAMGLTVERNYGTRSFAELAREAIELIASFNFGDIFPCLSWVDVLTGYSGRLKNNFKALDDIFDKVIEEHQKNSKANNNRSDNNSKDVVDILLNVMQQGTLDTINFNRDGIKAFLLDLIIAGTDTTAITLEWAMAELMKNPQAMKKAQQEVRNVMGNRTRVEEDDLNQMQYIKSTVKETLRLHPPATIVARETLATNDIQVNGYHIPPKTRVLFNYWAIQRDSNSWDRPHEFIPERFLDIQVNYKDTDCKLCPFGVGRRICPGITFGVVAIEILLANIICTFDWKIPNGCGHEEFNMEEITAFVVHRKFPLLLLPVKNAS